MEDQHYQGRVAVITGGAGGIGRETANVLLRLGATVVLVDVSEDSLTAASAELGRPDRVRVVRSDLSDYRACEAALEAAGRTVHVLVHLAGISVPDPEDPADVTVFDDVMAANTRSAYLIARAFERRHDGTAEDPARMVFASSLAYRRGGLDRVAYSAAKGAIAGMIRALARRFAPRILVNGVAPGVILTRMTDHLIATRGDALMAEIPLRRYGRPAEVARVIEFLAGPGSTYVNGQIINVDGGTVHS